MQNQTSLTGTGRRGKIFAALGAFLLGIACSVVAWFLFVPRMDKNSALWLHRNTPRIIYVDVVSGQVLLTPGENRYWTITVDPQTMHQPHVIGTFQMSNPPEQDLQVILAQQSEFEKWKKHQPADLLYFGDNMKGGSPDVRLPAPGDYILCFRNTSSNINKETSADIKLQYLAAPIKEVR